MFFFFIFYSKIVLLLLHLVVDLYLCTIHRLFGRTLQILEGPVLFVFLDTLILPSLANIFWFKSCTCEAYLQFSNGDFFIPLGFIFLRSFACCRSFFICPLIFISHPVFIFLFGFPILSLTIFAPVSINSFSSVMLSVGIWFNNSFTFSVSILTFSQSWFSRDGNEVFCSFLSFINIDVVLLFSVMVWFSIFSLLIRLVDSLLVYSLLFTCLHISCISR